MSDYEYKCPVPFLDLAEVHEPATKSEAEPLFVDSNIVQYNLNILIIFSLLSRYC